VPDPSAHRRSCARADGEVGPHLDALRRFDRWSISGDVLLANDAATLYPMSMNQTWQARSRSWLAHISSLVRCERHDMVWLAAMLAQHHAPQGNERSIDQFDLRYSAAYDTSTALIASMTWWP